MSEPESIMQPAPKREVDPNEAPDGYIAVIANGCGGCEFRKNSAMCEASACFSHDRKDECNVSFRERDSMLLGVDLAKEGAESQTVKVVCISAELSDSYVRLLRASQRMAKRNASMADEDDFDAAIDAVLKAGGGK